VLLWQTSQTINFAQGEFVMLPAFFVLAAMKFGGLSFTAALLVGLLGALLVLGLLFKRMVVDPILRHGVLPCCRWSSPRSASPSSSRKG
jgi:branched-chain amino acid transport system permease protein